jgi:serine/threonine protein phosphatase 1
MIITAIGDVHGSYDLLTSTLKTLPDTDELIFIGDLIDRTPQDKGDERVVTLVRDMQSRPLYYGFDKVTVLRGNHEQMFLDYIDGNDMLSWLYNGGSLDFQDFALTDPTVIKWMQSLPYYALRGNYMFVHAGVRPGLSLEEQDDFDYIWIRGKFLTEHHGLPYTIVHGHTIQETDAPVHADGRIAIDLGAYCTGNLGTITLDVPN